MTGLSEGLHANCRVPREQRLGETWHDGQSEEWGHSHYLNEPPLYELLVSGKKAMIDLREDHLSRCVRSRGRRSEVREGWRRMRSQKKEEEEEEGKCKEKQILLERPVFLNPGPAPSQMRRGGEIHTFHGGGLLRKSGLFFLGARAHNYHLRGARGATAGSRSPEKWEFLLLCESAVIIFIAPAAPSDPGSCTHRSQRAWPPELRLISNLVPFTACIILLVSIAIKWLHPSLKQSSRPNWWIEGFVVNHGLEL